MNRQNSSQTFQYYRIPSSARYTTLERQLSPNSYVFQHRYTSKQVIPTNLLSLSAILCSPFVLQVTSIRSSLPYATIVAVRLTSFGEFQCQDFRYTHPGESSDVWPTTHLKCSGLQWCNLIRHPSLQSCLGLPTNLCILQGL